MTLACLTTGEKQVVVGLKKYMLARFYAVIVAFTMADEDKGE